MLAAALAYHDAGLAVLPAKRAEKRPALHRWKNYQNAAPKRLEVETWFANPHDAICVLTGKASGNLELLDFDCQGELYPAWSEAVEASKPGLLKTLVIEQSQSGGRHVVYRCAEPVPGNMKLATKRITAVGPEAVEYKGKKYVPRPFGDAWAAVVCMIETRGEGGLFLCAPSPGYAIEQGSFSEIPTITADDREALLAAAYQLNEHIEDALPVSNPTAILRPGDDYNSRGDFRALLQRHNWRLFRPADERGNEHWTRPGKDVGTSATFKDGKLYVFTNNAPPLEPNRAYSPFAAFALLEHGGDYARAAAALRAAGYAGTSANATTVDLSGLCSFPGPTESPDVGELPNDLLNVPGFVSDVMTYNLATAPRPQPVLALAGALSLMATLAGRKVRDLQNNRTNVYFVSLAGSGEGKGHAMKVNHLILTAAAANSIEGPTKIGSDAGLISELQQKPAMLLQIDEFGRYLATMQNPDRGSWLHGVMTLIMELYSSADTLWQGKALRDKRPALIDQPCVVIHAVSAFESYRNALRGEALRDGSLARWMAFEAGELPDLTDIPFAEPPGHIVDAARRWFQWHPNPSPERLSPTPVLAQRSEQAAAVFAELRKLADAGVRKHRGDWQAAIWARTVEKASRLALVYACSRVPDPGAEEPYIDEAAAVWASRLSEYLTRRLITLGRDNVSESLSHAAQQAVVRVLREAGGSIDRATLREKTQRFTTQQIDDAIVGLRERDILHPVDELVQTRGRPRCIYRFAARPTIPSTPFPLFPRGVSGPVADASTAASDAGTGVAQGEGV